MAVLDPNILSVMGLRKILQDVMPVMEVVSFATLQEMLNDNPDSFVHFFVYGWERALYSIIYQYCSTTVISHLHKRYTHETITIITRKPEEVIHSILSMQQRGHGNTHMPQMAQTERKTLTAREVEVLVKVVEGYINKEIADLLNISITTVISHRKNITEKLGIKSVSGLTIYAVMNGYVDVNRI